MGKGVLIRPFPLHFDYRIHINDEFILAVRSCPKGYAEKLQQEFLTENHFIATTRRIQVRASENLISSEKRSQASSV